MPSPLCLDGAEAHSWISDPNLERCLLQPGRGGCSADSKGVELRKGFFQSGRKWGDPRTVPVPVQLRAIPGAVKSYGIPFAKGFVREGAPC